MKPRALALISGGLDSMLAAKMIMEQNIHVEGINFYTGFCGDDSMPVSCVKKFFGKLPISATRVANNIGFKLHIADVVDEYKRVVIKPKYGYGAHLNPCLDCKIFMVAKAKEWALKKRFDFIITGEVIGQRPKSQLKHMLQLIAVDSGAGDILLRPLCAKHLTPSLPECKGWVARELLGECCGRSRKPQFALAKKYAISEYAQPSGGCCKLIDEHYAKRLRDIWRVRGKKDYSLNDIHLLKVGRHLRPAANFKMIIGRNEVENNFLIYFRDDFISLECATPYGPLVLIDGDFLNEKDQNLALRIMARYCDHQTDKEVQIIIKKPHGEKLVENVLPLKKEELLSEWFV